LGAGAGGGGFAGFPLLPAADGGPVRWQASEVPFSAQKFSPPLGLSQRDALRGPMSRRTGACSG
jgi:hypothetical protein